MQFGVVIINLKTFSLIKTKDINSIIRYIMIDIFKLNS